MLAAVAIAFGIVVEANAQQIEIGKNTKIERSEVPIRILKSLENEFPETSNFQDQTWYLHYMEGKGSLERLIVISPDGKVIRDRHS